MHDGQCHPEPLIGIPLAMMNRHGLVAGATGTGKTKTLQLMTEGLSAAGVPVFVADIKGDVAGLAAPGQTSPRVEARAKETGVAWRPVGFPDRAAQPDRQAGRAAARDGVGVRAAGARAR